MCGRSLIPGPCSYNAPMDQRNDYTSAVRYEGPPPRRPRPWFLHPAFIVLVLLLLAGGGFMLKDRIAVMQLRSKGLNVEMVDGKPVIGLPERATLIGDEWQWREIDNSEQHYGLSSGMELYSDPADRKKEEREFRQKYGIDDNSIEDYQPPEYDREQYDFLYWGGGKQYDLDGDGVYEIIQKKDTRHLSFHPQTGWHDLGSKALHHAISNENIDNAELWLDFNGDGVLDMARTYLGDDIDWSKDVPRGTLSVFDGSSGKRLATYQMDLVGEVLAGDFDGDGSTDLAYQEKTSHDSGHIFRVRSVNGLDIGQILVAETGMRSHVLDTDGDGRDEIICNPWKGGLFSAGIGKAETRIAEVSGMTMTSPFMARPGGSPGLVVVSSPLQEALDFSGMLDFDDTLDFDSDAYKQKMADMEKRMKEFTDLAEQLDPPNEHPMLSPMYDLDAYRHFQSLSAGMKDKLRSTFTLVDLASGKRQQFTLPASYTSRNVTMSSGFENNVLRLPAYQGDLLFIQPTTCGAVLVISLDGSYVHYEELGEIPLHSEVIKGAANDHIMLVFENRILVYP